MLTKMTLVRLNRFKCSAQEMKIHLAQIFSLSKEPHSQVNRGMVFVGLWEGYHAGSNPA